MKLAMWSLGMFLALMGAGCGSFSGSCSTKSNGNVTNCVEYEAGFNADQLKAACSVGANQTYSADACPSANRVARCKQSSSATGVSLTNHFYPPNTAANIMQVCVSGNGITSEFTAN